mmetsp:Transcript_56418/g.181144  ORF Transcript_56418/g.181144 Transcript_56418/m.181144 type:complete len:231 (-) Transcript_56418:166-858(-)
MHVVAQVRRAERRGVPAVGEVHHRGEHRGPQEAGDEGANQGLLVALFPGLLQAGVGGGEGRVRREAEGEDREGGAEALGHKPTLICGHLRQRQRRGHCHDGTSKKQRHAGHGDVGEALPRDQRAHHHDAGCHGHGHPHRQLQAGTLREQRQVDAKTHSPPDAIEEKLGHAEEGGDTAKGRTESQPPHGLVVGLRAREGLLREVQHFAQQQPRAEVHCPRREESEEAAPEA